MLKMEDFILFIFFNNKKHIVKGKKRKESKECHIHAVSQRQTNPCLGEKEDDTHTPPPPPGNLV